MKVIKLRSDTDTDYIACPITTQAEQEIKELIEAIQQWPTRSVEIGELTDDEVTYYERLGLLSRVSTEEEGLEMARNWVISLMWRQMRLDGESIGEEL